MTSGRSTVGHGYVASKALAKRVELRDRKEIELRNTPQCAGKCVRINSRTVKDHVLIPGCTTKLICAHLQHIPRGDFVNELHRHPLMRSSTSPGSVSLSTAHLVTISVPLDNPYAYLSPPTFAISSVPRSPPNFSKSLRI